MKRLAVLCALCVLLAGSSVADWFDDLKREAADRPRLLLWDDDGCDMTH